MIYHTVTDIDDQDWIDRCSEIDKTVQYLKSLNDCLGLSKPVEPALMIYCNGETELINIKP